VANAVAEGHSVPADFVSGSNNRTSVAAISKQPNHSTSDEFAVFSDSDT
jgi:hypothetical protein